MPTKFGSITKWIKTDGGLLSKKRYSEKQCIHMNKLPPMKCCATSLETYM